MTDNETVATVVMQISSALNGLIDMLPIAPPVDPTPAQEAVVGVVAEPTTLPTAATSLAAAVSSAIAGEIATATASPPAYATQRACQVTKGRPQFCTPGSMPSPTVGPLPTVPSPLPVLPSATAAVGSAVPEVGPLQALPSDNPVCMPSFAPSLVKKYVCQP